MMRGAKTRLDEANSFKMISFDMNGTLTEDHFVELVWGEGIPSLYSMVADMPLDQAKLYVKSEYDKVGEDRVEWYDIKYWFRHFGLGDGWMAMLESFKHAARAFSDAQSTLEALGRHYELVVVSNAPAEFIEIELDSLRGYFSRVFSCTTDFGEVKKTPAVYQRVCDALGVTPGQIAHVGDHRVFDYTAPRALGIQAYHLDRKGVVQGEHVVHSLLDFCRKVFP